MIKYRIAKQLYLKGLYGAVIRIAGANAHLKALPFREGQPLKVQTKSDTIVGMYLGTIRDGFLLSVSGHPTTILFAEVEQISVYWH